VPHGAYGSYVPPATPEEPERAIITVVAADGVKNQVEGGILKCSVKV
jgi:hypothetical protein